MQVTIKTLWKQKVKKKKKKIEILREEAVRRDKGMGIEAFFFSYVC